jgi:TolB-like protein/DNA-binding winged helix-turn-helix (wHTH) protein/Tfp pilus assembly protein PilF
VRTRFGPFEADLEARELRKGRVHIRIHEQSFQVLEALLKRPGELVTRDELRHAIWPDDTFVDFDQSLNKVVSRLRAALSDTAANPRFVETLSRRGYRLLVPVESGESPAAVLTAAEPSWSHPPRPARRRWLVRLGLAGAVVVLAAFALWLLPRPAPITSIVVLPFTNLSGNAEQEYFVDGITHAITAELAGIPGLRIVSTTSAMHYKTVKKPLPVIARELGVDGIIEGAMLRTGNRVRMLLKLIEVPSERTLWSETYEVDVQDISRLQSDVVRLVASETRIALSPEKQRLLAEPRRIDPEALDAYLKGFSLAQQRTEPALKESIQHFQHAIAVDPNYPQAYAGLARTYNLMTSFHLMPGKEGYAKLTAAAQNALELDNTMAEAYSLLATSKLYGEWDWATAETLYKRALELNPSHASGHQRYALGLMWTGRFADARAHIRRAQETDPLSVIMRSNEGEILYNERQYDQAIEYFRRAIEVDSKFFATYWFLGLSYIKKGTYDDGIRALQTAIKLGGGPGVKSSLGYSFAQAGRRSDAIAILHELRSADPKYLSAYDVAVVYAGLGEKQQAFDWLNKSYDDHSRQMVYLQVAPLLDELRPDPRFPALVKRVGVSR